MQTVLQQNAINLDNPQDRTRLVARIQHDIDQACREEFAEDPRTHLGASIIGHDCAAYSWNVFRWLKFEKFDGRMLRLFNRGHEEEARFIRWLKLAGFEVYDVDPETGKQFRIVGSKGHFGGSLDSILKAPARYNIRNLLYWLGEFKTHNEKSFAKLKKDGVAKSKPQHFKQMCSYGRAYQFKYGLYCAVNKNTDELYFEIVVLDYRQADDLFRKADDIVFSRIRPPKIAQVATYFECKYCDFSGLCHDGQVPTKNCRSCKHAVPIDNAEWFCELYSPERGPLPKEFIPEGCDDWRAVA